jgi:hypothetical protein
MTSFRLTKRVFGARRRGVYSACLLQSNMGRRVAKTKVIGLPGRVYVTRPLDSDAPTRVSGLHRDAIAGCTDTASAGCTDTASAGCTDTR